MNTGNRTLFNFIQNLIYDGLTTNMIFKYFQLVGIFSQEIDEKKVEIFGKIGERFAKIMKVFQKKSGNIEKTRILEKGSKRF